MWSQTACMPCFPFDHVPTNQGGTTASFLTTAARRGSPSWTRPWCRTSTPCRSGSRPTCATLEAQVCISVSSMRLASRTSVSIEGSLFRERLANSVYGPCLARSSYRPTQLLRARRALALSERCLFGRQRSALLLLLLLGLVLLASTRAPTHALLLTPCP